MGTSMLQSRRVWLCLWYGICCCDCRLSIAVSMSGGFYLRLLHPKWCGCCLCCVHPSVPIDTAAQHATAGHAPHQLLTAPCVRAGLSGAVCCSVTPM